MNYKAFQDIELSRLGLGNMRLPALNPGDPKSPIDWEKAHEIIDYAIANGITYYDTAYVYNGGESERCLGAALKKYPRDQYYIATKFNIGANPDYRAVFEEQLDRLQTDYIDFYLCHCLLDGNVDTYLQSGCIEYFLEQKAKGRIRYLGFSSHAGLEALTKFADHHQWDFAQLQINYFDWKYANTRQEYQILADRSIPVMVMEPVRGGRLSALTPEAEELLHQAHPDWSVSAWALRFARSLPQVQVVLSGMSNMDQIRENVATFSSPEIFTEEDEKLLFEACDMFKQQVQVPCTSCRYCCDGCPMQINIPEFLKVYNDYKVNGKGALRKLNQVESEGKPTACIGCGACTGHCPQNIPVPDIMAELADLMES